jgi:hypothetical protein
VPFALQISPPGLLAGAPLYQLIIPAYRRRITGDDAFLRRRVVVIGYRSFPHQLNPLHFTVACKTSMAVAPMDRHIPRLDRGYRANVGRVAVETDASAGFEFAGFVGGH